jgi:hypothetical protein
MADDLRVRLCAPKPVEEPETALDVRLNEPIAPMALLLMRPARLFGPPGPMLKAGLVCVLFSVGGFGAFFLIGLAAAC